MPENQPPLSSPENQVPPHNPDVDPDRLPGDCADDAAGDVELSQLRTLA